MIIKAFKHCPICRSLKPFKKHNPNHILWQASCVNPNCGFFQYFVNSFEEDIITYFQFFTDDFNIYVYGERMSSIKNITHIYHRVFSKGVFTQMPLISWENWYPDFDNLDKLNNKLKTLALFK
jgi:hypothetical protein